MNHQTVPLPGLAGRARRRTWLLAVVAIAAAAALAVGAGWSVAGGDPPGPATPPLAGPATEPADGATAEPAGATGRPTGSPGPAPATPDLATGSGPDSASPDSPGEPPAGGGSGAGTPANQPPVIEDPGVSSEGLLLRIEPTVSDPDGDQVSLRIEVAGAEVPSMDPTRAAIRLDHTEVGYRYQAPVRITATDSQGATTRRELTHLLEAITTVHLSGVSFQVSRPADCFRDVPERSLTGAIRLTGGFDAGQSFTVRLDRDRPGYTFFTGSSTVVTGVEPEQTVALLRSGFAGTAATFTKTHRDGSVRQGVRAYSGDCAGHYTYGLRFEVR